MAEQATSRGQGKVASTVPSASEKGTERLAWARSLMERGSLDSALKVVEEILDDHPDLPDALYMRAACLRYTHQTPKALRSLRKLMEVAPEYGRAYQEAGHCQRKLGHNEEALAAYRQAVKLNPGLIASWKALTELEPVVGDENREAVAKRYFERLANTPKELVSVTSMIHEGRLFMAERLCRDFLIKNPHHVEGMRLLAQIGLELFVLDDAEFLLESALEFEPDNDFVRFDYITVLHRRQKYEKALEQAEILRSRQPGNPSYETSYANELVAVGRFDEALAVYDAVLERMPDNPKIHLARGHAFKTVGRQEEAIAAYQAAYKAKPDMGDAFWSLANLKTYRFTDLELQHMETWEKRSVTFLEDRYHMAFALGKAYEDREDHERSFHYYETGNSLKRRELRYDPERMAADLQRQMDICTPDLFKAKEGMGCDAPDPIFIVGLPRAGSTLIEQILASHSQVDGTMELPNIPATAHRLNGRRRIDEEQRYPAILHELDDEKLTQLGEAFIEDTRVHRRGAPYFIDKMPNNFRHLGLIKLILPNAKIIDARRDPMDCCFSGFKQLFAEGQEFSYSLSDIGRYYTDYVRLMDHWDQVLPGQVLRVQYEDVVEDLEGQVRRMLEFLELPFEEACLNFHETDRAVRTASSEQVRQPVSRKGIGQWKPYEPWLGELRDALGELAR